MEYIHVKNLEKYLPGYTDRTFAWLKLYFRNTTDPHTKVKHTGIFNDEEFMALDEIDQWRLIKLACLEANLGLPVPLTNRNVLWMGWNLKKRSKPKTLQMLHSFIQVSEKVLHRVEKRRVEKRRVEKKFVPPKIEEIIKYIQESPELSNIDPQDFFKGYSDGGWIDTQGKPVRNWKLKLRTRSKFEAERNPSKICYLCGKLATKYRTEMGKRQYICNECLPKEAPKRLPPKRKDKELVTRDKTQEQISKLAESMDSS